MTDEEFKELIRILTQPHRVQNVFALFRHCEEAAELLQTQRSELEELRLKAPKTNNPKKMIEKLKTEISKKEKATGSKKKRARDEKGRLIGDDPNTPENEAWVSDTPEGTA